MIKAKQEKMIAIYTQKRQQQCNNGNNCESKIAFFRVIHITLPPKKIVKLYHIKIKSGLFLIEFYKKL